MNMDTLIISNFKEENLEKILEIENKISYNQWTRQMFLDEYNNKSSFFKIAYIQNNIIGFIIYRIILDEAEILNIVVDTPFRGKHFGKELLNNAITDFLNKNIKNIFLEVRKSNLVAINLYKEYGFNEYSIRKNYYNNEDAILMKKTL
ncbi:MAG: ribosomal protein S18-alanine N-acetyltransferase [Endomicrobiaceae bacterium]|nr:ribosomal protein S18-alanine N-acetyltransferase [Endomicrobiaceae bacterium]MDD5101923.1 ribosomal protein S18-alanine N-acetyltransferase [Endomicrobiaceae bacterium]